jgi:hypothetical protein
LKEYSCKQEGLFFLGQQVAIGYSEIQIHGDCTLGAQRILISQRIGEGFYGFLKSIANKVIKRPELLKINPYTGGGKTLGAENTRDWDIEVNPMDDATLREFVYCVKEEVIQAWKESPEFALKASLKRKFLEMIQYVNHVPVLVNPNLPCFLGSFEDIEVFALYFKKSGNFEVLRFMKDKKIYFEYNLQDTKVTLSSEYLKVFEDFYNDFSDYFKDPKDFVQERIVQVGKNLILLHPDQYQELRDFMGEDYSKFYFTNAFMDLEVRNEDDFRKLFTLKNQKPLKLELNPWLNEELSSNYQVFSRNA